MALLSTQLSESPGGMARLSWRVCLSQLFPRRPQDHRALPVLHRGAGGPTWPAEAETGRGTAESCRTP